ncbi:hypothetical protein [Dyella sp.]|uniref:hypothetical protein n=1 Tax=Dyella sp. TaxID=1869338 RepID=UPI002D76C02C|nr:hypothetical protein [Dyella sp.]HET6433778.1 hypothetical protein [Dyella sp.]
MPTTNRNLTSEEHQLVRWLLEHGNPGAVAFLPQLEQALVTPWRCACGCASFNFAVPDKHAREGGMHILSDFLFGSPSELSGVFVYEQAGILSGLEVYGLAGEAPKTLPSIGSLRPFSDATGPA